MDQETSRFDSIKIKGFRSLRAAELPLDALTAFIGPNGSGKSNFMDLLNLMAEASYGLLADGIAKRGGFDNISFKGDPGDVQIEFNFKPEGVFQEERTPVKFRLTLKRVGSYPRVWLEQIEKAPDAYHFKPLQLMRRDKDGCEFRSVKTGMTEELEKKALESESELAIFQVKDKDKYPTPYKLLRLLQDWAFYRDINVGPNAPIRQPDLVRPTVRLAADGGNLASVLYSIQQQHPATWKEIEEILETVYPDFHSITFPPEGGDGKVLLRWWERPFEKKSGFSASLLSDGTLKLLCLLAILKTPDPPPMICIDEPELGLHPDWIKVVAELLLSAATRTQIIIATHSPQLVSKLEPSNVVITEKSAGETRFRHLDKNSLKKWLEEFSLGDLWLAGHFGGRPA
ncbi:MAG TPA: AAA family ATPase [Candidatus Angelobacter sp.]|jgi:predicted ATPase